MAATLVAVTGAMAAIANPSEPITIYNNQAAITVQVIGGPVISADTAGTLMTQDEARRIAANIAKLPNMLHRP